MDLLGQFDTIAPDKIIEQLDSAYMNKFIESLFNNPESSYDPKCI